MQERYDFNEVEPRIARLWDEHRCFAPRPSGPRAFSMFLIPPNASGPMHVGNALMIAIGDVLARYHRAQGRPTLWIPGTDHGGYETQVTFERELEARGESKDDYTRAGLYDAIAAFVARNNKTIKRQIGAMGASVDWSHVRYTLDGPSRAFVGKMFKRMVDDRLLYRSSYMVNYCPQCATMLADIELKEEGAAAPLYFIKFPFKKGDGYLTLATSRPEFLYSVTHVLAHPQDERFAGYIGMQLINPATGQEVEVIESGRRWDPEHAEPHLGAFMPSAVKYDFEYAIRHKLPARNLLDWEGRMVERHPGLLPEEARPKEVEYLQGSSAIERVEEAIEPTYYCKKGHAATTIIRMSWFVRLDDPHHPLRKPALDSIERERLVVYPHWRLKGLTEWIGKMHDWPVSRQNVWGIRMPIYYEAADPSLLTVWFVSGSGERRFGNLQTLLEDGVTFEEVAGGLERVYAAEGCRWTLEPETGKLYLPETDTFDTWFSSSAWGSVVFDPETNPELKGYYPSSVVVIGQDLLRLSIARKILLSRYLSGKLPMRRVYFHQLLRSEDGQKMSKSLGNAVELDEYLREWGADVTRMALLSYTGAPQDFYLEPQRLRTYRHVAKRLWAVGAICGLADPREAARVGESEPLLAAARALRAAVGSQIDKYAFAQAQERAVAFLAQCEAHVAALGEGDDADYAAAVVRAAFKTYLEVLHPFMPFMTEELYMRLYRPAQPLASVVTTK